MLQPVRSVDFLSTPRHVHIDYNLVPNYILIYICLWAAITLFCQGRNPMRIINLIVKVSADGTYQRKTLPQVTYLTMTFVRSMIVGQASLELAKASTIATRYSAVRHQTANSKG